MHNLLIVNNPQKWPFHLPEVEVISARSYLTKEIQPDHKRIHVFNLCRSYRYQSMGYYVSLLAAARGHKPLPSIETIQDMKSLSILRSISDEVDELIQHSLKPLQSDQFILSIYFGQNLAKRYDRLCRQLFKLFPAPFLRAVFRKNSDQRWQLHKIGPIADKEVPEDHHEFVIESAKAYFISRRRTSRRHPPRFDLAILHNPKEDDAPSNGKALEKFTKAARQAGFGVELIEKEDYGFIPQYDALFIRETTNVNHHTYRFSRRASAEGLVVIDDPVSIQKCSNKVFLAELLARHRIPHPKTLIVHRDNQTLLPETIGFPCILKKPDSSFSQGVYKIDNSDELETMLKTLFDGSDLLIAQEFMPTPFDWRVGILDRQPLYVCKYYMAEKHWQIQNNQAEECSYGQVEACALESVLPAVIKTAVRAANLIGDGLYGVDLKQVNKKVFVIEINDNPSIDAGYEDQQLQDELYNQIMAVFLIRVEQRKSIS